MSEPVTVTPHTLSDDELKDIGRLVRAFAEIEDIVAVHLCQVGSLNEGQLAVLVGRLGISQRVKMAEQFAKGLGGAAWEAHKACFKSGAFKTLVDCRNAVAHGYLLGLTKEGTLAFRTASMSDVDPEFVTLKVVTYAPASIRRNGEEAVKLVAQLDQILRTSKRRKEHLSQSLRPRSTPTQGTGTQAK